MAINTKNINSSVAKEAGSKKRSVPDLAANDASAGARKQSAAKRSRRKTSRTGGNTAKPPLFSKQRLSADDRMFFTEQLALLLDTGNSLPESLQALGTHGPSPALGKLVNQLGSDLQGGMSFSQTLAKHPDFFSSTYCNLVKASEQGGFMSEVLEELRAMDEKRAKLQATIQAALSYPLFLAGFSVLTVLFVLIVVFPKFGDMFGSMQSTLPASTRYLMAFSDSLVQNWPFYLGGGLALGLGIWHWANSDRGSSALDGLKLRMPVAKNIFSELYLVQSMRVMGLSLDKGVSVVDTLDSCKDVVENQRYREFFRTLDANVQGGRGLAVGFRDCEFIPDIVKQMITTGEASGNLPKVMDRVAGYYERQLEKRLTMLSKAAEPVMLLVMGVVVGVLVSSLILPIFQMSKVSG